MFLLGLGMLSIQGSTFAPAVFITLAILYGENQPDSTLRPKTCLRPNVWAVFKRKVGNRLSGTPRSSCSADTMNVALNGLWEIYWRIGVSTGIKGRNQADIP
jgi:hypothetical protein